MSESNSIQVAVADDHGLFRKGIETMLGMIPGIEFVFAAANGRELLTNLKTQPAEIILLDLDMPEMDGREALSHLITDFPNSKAIILSMYNDDKHVVSMLEAGARGYLSKDVEVPEMENAIRSVAATGYYFNDHISILMLKKLTHQDLIRPTFPVSDQLSPRELEVLGLICQEFTNAEIAEKLFLSPRTVDGHRNRMLHKTGARNTAGLVLYAVKKSLVELD